MKQTNYQKWQKYKVLSEKYFSLFIEECKRELELCVNEEKKKKILMKLVLAKEPEPEKEVD